MSASILLVDDEVGITNSLKRVLRKDGYSLTAVDSGVAALEILKSQPFDMVISDQRMPEMTGATLLTEVNRLYPKTSRILFSGYCDFSALSEAVNDAAIQRFLLKPWIDSEVREEIRHVLEQSHLEHFVRENIQMNSVQNIEHYAKLENNQLFNYFQPIFNSCSHQMYGAALIQRWHHYEMGLLETDEFFPLFQHCQNVRESGVQQMDQLFDYLRLVIQRLKVCLKVSPAQLDSSEYFKKLQNFCMNLGDASQQVIIEISENELARSVIDVAPHLKLLKQQGINIALGNFCTDYLSADYLKTLPIDIVKIDRRFTKVFDSKNQFIVSSIVELGQQHKLDVIAEGVEKPEQVTKLNQLGCFLHQGYVYGKPR